MQWLKTLRETLKHESVGPIIRRFFINTLFDSTFMLLGIIVGSAFAGAAAGLNVIIITMLTTSLALGISTGVSVYEAESLEQERKIADLEKALFTDLDDTSIQKTAKYTILIATLINFATPLFSCAVTITPFILVAMGILRLNIAGWISVVLALSTLFGAGVYMGRIGKTNPYKKGLRMVAFGVLAFAIGFLLNLLL
jgi:predicted membrane protein (TIGR00267 family)